MNRMQFLSVIAGVTALGGISGYLLSEKKSLVRAGTNQDLAGSIPLEPAERYILYLASLAPSGHNTQPWFIKFVDHYHWIVCNDPTRWLPAVDSTQRETILSIGAFLQNLECAANHLGYRCDINVMATSNQDENIAAIKLNNAGSVTPYTIEKIVTRRTVRSGYLNDPLKTEDLAYLLHGEPGTCYFPGTSREYQWLNEQTIEANRIQCYRDTAQRELSNWVRFSNKDAAVNRDGLTTAGMEIEGIPGWLVRNYYERADVLKKSFRDQSIAKVKDQVRQSAGWLLITSKDNTVNTLLETGKRMQRIFLQVREKNIAIHPMTQILEEPVIHQVLPPSISELGNIQFILRTGYIKNYPAPVSLRRPVDWFLHNAE